MLLPEPLKLHIAQETLIYAVLSRPTASCHLQKVTIRPIFHRHQYLYQISEQCGPQVFHRNIAKEDLADLLMGEFGEHFHQGVYYTRDADYHLLISRKGKQTLLRKKPTRQPELRAHNRAKKYRLEEGIPRPFLIELGIMNGAGKIFPKKMDKFRQINRFLEIAGDTFDALPTDRSLQIIDFGCGKSYLTFALYEYLLEMHPFPPQVIGLDLKSEVIANCNALANRLEYTSLRFEVGDIAGYTPSGEVDMVVCLHACDTATDAALEKAARWNSKVILAVPCCQKELYSQLDQPALTSLLRHGILRERFAALVTDAARADLLEMKGYRCQIMEFIDLEHTPKNLLIRAIKSDRSESMEVAASRYRELASTLHLLPCLERLLQR